MGKKQDGMYETPKVEYETQNVEVETKEDIEILGWEVVPTVDPVVIPTPEPKVVEDRPWENDLSRIYTDGRMYRCPECKQDSPVQWVPGLGFTHVSCGHNSFSTRCNGCSQ